MNESQFNQLCDTCDSILKKGEISTEILSISWLHIIREHPLFLSRYERLFCEIIKSPLHWMGLRRSVIETLRFSRQLFRSVLQGVLQKNISHSYADLVFVSHRIKATKENEDFYFGALPEELATKGIKVVVIQIDHTSDSKSYVRTSSLENKNLKWIILPSTLSTYEEIRMFLDMLKVSKKLAHNSENNDFRKSVKFAASAESLSSATFQTLRIAKQISNIVGEIKPKHLITTFEGHAWERATIHLSKKKHFSIKCVGYQHAALFRLQHSIRRKLGSGTDPDFIWTSGRLAFEELKQEKKLSDINIVCVGSIRVTDNVIGDSTSRFQEKEELTCLVLPEGLKSECNFLFEFSIKCAKIFPELQFIWRLHPIINFNDLSTINPRLQNLPSNIIISTENIQTDIARSDCAMYRGTTAIIQAVIAGIVPIYVARERELSIDPLYGAKYGVAKISSPEKLLDSVKEVMSREEKNYLKKYCQEFFSPMASAAEIKTLLEDI